MNVRVPSILTMISTKYTQDCSTVAIAKLARKDGYKGVHKNTLDKYMQSINLSVLEDINAQASVDAVQLVCQMFGWAIPIIARVVRMDGTVVIQKYMPVTKGPIYWRSSGAISLVYDTRSNSGHFEACHMGIVNDDGHIIAHGFSWAYI
jgi:hypothetical protein